MNIGDWVRRDRNDRPYHYVDSTVASSFVTRCGKRMAFEDNEGTGYVLFIPSQTEGRGRPLNGCEVCRRSTERDLSIFDKP